ncbi:hypothetical protein QBC32DRAFT_67811 [Pseudoneurospora amorphoporcata]|uniref:Secreted protein n=1 Tax=Pseudoneurospora amorphoporcata TaxID=241081 RepID=A0AAN6P3C6_9PEZI|nr:hypothetical protein QBC32DRAFT_67811 [Pseudoneurospora amorphoporcata]
MLSFVGCLGVWVFAYLEPGLGVCVCDSRPLLLVADDLGVAIVDVAMRSRIDNSGLTHNLPRIVNGLRSFSFSVRFSQVSSKMPGFVSSFVSSWVVVRW